MLQRSVAVSEADMDASKKSITAKNMEIAFSVTFFTVMGFLLASTSVSETATKVQFFVAVSEADMDASKKPITVQNMEIAFSTSTSEMATNAELRALSFDMLESLSRSFRGCFNSLGNFV